MKLKLSFCICFLLSFSFYGQLLTTIKGKVFSKEDESIVNTAMVTIPKSNRSVLVNDQGEFVLESWQNPPLQVKVSAVGFKDYYYTLKTKKDKIQVFLEEEITSLNEIVVSASRTPEHVFESPVSIETFSATAIENNSSANFFDGLENLKGVM